MTFNATMICRPMCGSMCSRMCMWLTFALSIATAWNPTMKVVCAVPN